MQEILRVCGFQVAPAELEGHLLQHPDVADTCVVGVPDDYSGEVPLAFVVLSADAAKTALRSEAEAAKIKAAISQVRSIFICSLSSVKRSDWQILYFLSLVIDVIPKSSSGKLLRRTLRDKAASARRQSQPPTKAWL